MCCITVRIGQSRSQSLTPNFHHAGCKLGVYMRGWELPTAVFSVVSELIDQCSMI